MKYKQCLAITQHRGSVLITTLILLVMLTILSLTMISMNVTQTRIAGNSADAQQAYQTAEGAINQATTNILAGNYDLVAFLTNSNGLYTFDATVMPRWQSVSWSSATDVIFCSTCGLGTQAAYLVEYLPPANIPGYTPRQVYRITARALGISGKSPVMLQSTVLTP